MAALGPPILPRAPSVPVVFRVLKKTHEKHVFVFMFRMIFYKICRNAEQHYHLSSLAKRDLPRAPQEPLKASLDHLEAPQEDILVARAPRIAVLFGVSGQTPRFLRKCYKRRNTFLHFSLLCVTFSMTSSFPQAPPRHPNTPKYAPGSPQDRPGTPQGALQEPPERCKSIPCILVTQ